MGSLSACRPGLRGWLLSELSAGRTFLPGCGSKGARAHRTRIRNARHGPTSTGRPASDVHHDRYRSTQGNPYRGRGRRQRANPGRVHARIVEGPGVGLGRSQKNGPNDARSVAIAALRSDRLTLVVADDHPQVLRVLVKRHRDTAQLRAKQVVRLSALLCELQPGGTRSKTTPSRAIQLLEGLDVVEEVTRARVLIAREHLDDIARLDTALGASRTRISSAVTASGTTLCDIVGVGPICAATILGHTGNIERFSTKAQFAMYNATAPIEASSGGKVRHRLNQRGNRQLNFAIHIAAVVQIRTGGEGRVFYDRKIAEGKSRKEAIRSLKRRISDRVYSNLAADARRAATV